MKQLIVKLILPLSIISFALFTKWWHVFVEDVPDTFFTGFPLPYVCKGWHTSLSLQIFIGELLFDFLIYFLFWYIMALAINYLGVQIKILKLFSKGLWVISIFFLTVGIILTLNPDNIFYSRCTFKMQVKKTGYTIGGYNITKPNCYNIPK